MRTMRLETRKRLSDAREMQSKSTLEVSQHGQLNPVFSQTHFGRENKYNDICQVKKALAEIEQVIILDQMNAAEPGGYGDVHQQVSLEPNKRAA